MTDADSAGPGDERAVALGLLDMIASRRRVGPPAPYLRRHLTEHLGRAGLDLDEHLPDEVLPYLDLDRLAGVLRVAEDAGDSGSSGVRAAVPQVSHLWDFERPGQNAAALQMWRAVSGAPYTGRTVGPWHVAWAHGLTDPSTVLGRLAGDVTALAVVATGDAPERADLVVSGGGEGGVCLWHIEGRLLHAVPRAHEGPVLGVAVRAGTVITVGADGRLRTWRLTDTGSSVTLAATVDAPVHRGPAEGVAVLNEGAVGEKAATEGPWVVTVGRDAVVRLVRLVDGQVVATVRAPGPLTAVAAAGPGRIVTGDAGGVLRWWRWGTDTAGSELAPDTDRPPRGVHAGAVLSVAVLGADGDIVSGGLDGLVARTGADGRAAPALVGQPGPRSHAVACVPAPTGKGLVVVATRGERVLCWTVGTSVVPGTWPSSISTSTNLAVAATVSGERVIAVTGGRDDEVRRWSLAPTAGVASDQGDGEGAQVLAIGPVGHAEVVLVGGASGTVVARNLSDGTVVRTWDGHTTPITGLATAAGEDGRDVVIAAAFDGSLRAWSGEGVLWADPIVTRDGTVRSLDALTLPDGSAGVVTTSWDGAVRMRRLATGEVVAGLVPEPGRALCSAVLGPGPLVAVGTDDGRVLRWDTSVSAPAEEIDRHGGRVVLLAGRVGSEGALVVSADDSGRLRSWTGHGGSTEVARTAGIDALRVLDAPGPPSVVTTSPDRWLRVWDVTERAVDPARLPLRRPTNALATSSGGVVAVAAVGLVVAQYRHRTDPRGR